MPILNAIVSFLSSAMGASATIAVVLEFVFHAIPSEKPLGILHGVAGAFGMIGKIFSMAGDLLDKVLPQSLVKPSA